MPYAHITGWGMSVPEPVLTNEDISKFIDTTDEWIRERTGIRERRIARESDFPSTLGTAAALKALRGAPGDPVSPKQRAAAVLHAPQPRRLAGV